MGSAAVAPAAHTPWALQLGVVLTCLLATTCHGLNHEGWLLLTLKKQMVDTFHHLDDWNPGDPSPCGWKGVNCSSGSTPAVVSLNLSNMNLSGTVDPSIGGLTELTNLDLSFNGFSGTIPAEIGNCSKLTGLYLNNNQFQGTIPPELGKLTMMITFNLCNNKLFGPIPDEIGNMASLEDLVGYSNNLSGSIPHTIGRLKNLKTVRLGQNAISGNIPVEIGECLNLVVFGLAQNKLGGPLPKEIGKLTLMTDLILWGNQLSGVIPPEIGNCINLRTIALYDNNLVGPIPATIGNIQNLQRLYLYRNLLNGTIPLEIANLSLAEEIDFSENVLTGGVPKEFGKIPRLYLLYLFQNQLTGPIPTELCVLKNLSKLDLSINTLSGPIPACFQYMSRLIQLQLFNNMLSGDIPPRFGIYSRLWVVDFSNNNITGQIPRDLCRQSNLILLNLGANKLIGNIPHGITRCKSLVQLRLADNSLTGSFPTDLCNLVNLTTIELGRNKFNGPIPPQIGNCKALQRLDLTNNYFTSELPQEIGNLSKLVVFNISSNRLGGSIPLEIFNCTMLQRLDLSQNSFEGSLPNEVGSLPQLELLSFADNRLSGQIPPILGKLSHLTALQIGGNQFSGGIPKELGLLSSLQIAMNLSYNNLSGNIPSELGNLALLENLFLNNNKLTGEIPDTFANLSSLLEFNVSYNNLTGALPTVPLFDNMASTCFLGNKGLCGGQLGKCGSESVSSSQSSNSGSPPLGKVIAIVAAVIGGISLILIVIIVYHMRKPLETVAPLQDKQIFSAGSNMQVSTKDAYTFQELVSATNNFDESCVIGRGACGTVYRAILKAGQTIAVKKLASNREGSNTDNSFRAEILTLGKIRHRNIVKLYGFIYHQGSNLLLYEYMPRGSLGELLHGQSSSSLDWETRFMIALGAAEGLSYLHHDCKPRIIHRDIKSNNILLDENFEAHVGDFGLAKVIDMPYSKSMSAIAGSYGYIAPEYAYTMKVTEKSDIYSYGVVLLELLTGRAPVQPLELGGDLVTWVKNYIRDNSLGPGILDKNLDLEDKTSVDHMIEVLKIALLCTSMSPYDRPPMRNRPLPPNRTPHPHHQFTMAAEEGRSPHVVLFPFLAHGHIPAFLRLAGHLQALRPGLAVTLVSTQRILGSLSLPATSPPIQLHALPFAPADHGLPDGAHSLADLHVHQFITFFQASESLRPAFDGFVAGIRSPVCIIADAFFAWTADVARARGASHAVFLPGGAFGNAVFFSVWEHLPHTLTAGDEFPLLPDFPDVVLHRTQIPPYMLAATGADPWTAFFRRVIPSCRKTDAVLVNTVQQLEPSGLDMLRASFGVQTWPIGPILAAPAPSKSRDDDDITIIQWLDAHPRRSVLYISFGSQNSISIRQMTELALGLEASGWPFIWAVRPPLGFDPKDGFDPEWLPAGFEDRMAARASGRGLVVRGWAPQARILAHPSTGAFLTHCGNNSRLALVVEMRQRTRS
uniref:non-specific serine/threonine protein kinase n=1 Tax=Oryza punctata TaxID=4537 RepID=A0A0E0KSJ9_ORYPU